MTKREQKALLAKLDRLTAKVGKKRDELRALIGDVSAVVESVEGGIETLESAIGSLNDARRCIEDAADELSQYA